MLPGNAEKQRDHVCTCASHLVPAESTLCGGAATICCGDSHSRSTARQKCRTRARAPHNQTQSEGTATPPGTPRKAASPGTAPGRPWAVPRSWRFLLRALGRLPPHWRFCAAPPSTVPRAPPWRCWAAPPGTVPRKAASPGTAPRAPGSSECPECADRLAFSRVNLDVSDVATFCCGTFRIPYPYFMLKLKC